jgi:hypothetical protein
VPPLYELGADRASACFLRDPATQSTEETTT